MAAWGSELPSPCCFLTLRGCVAVEFGLMSTTTDRATASAYSGVDKERGTVLEIVAGQVGKGASPNHARLFCFERVCSTRRRARLPFAVGT